MARTMRGGRWGMKRCGASLALILCIFATSGAPLRHSFDLNTDGRFTRLSPDFGLDPFGTARVVLEGAVVVPDEQDALIFYGSNPSLRPAEARSSSGSGVVGRQQQQQQQQQQRQQAGESDSNGTFVPLGPPRTTLPLHTDDRPSAVAIPYGTPRTRPGPPVFLVVLSTSQALAASTNEDRSPLMVVAARGCALQASWRAFVVPEVAVPVGKSPAEALDENFGGAGRAPLIDGPTMRSAETSRFALYAINCAGPEVRLRGSVHFLNPGDEELSREQVPLVAVYATLFAMSLVASAAWAFSAWGNRAVWSSLHTTLAVAISLKVLDVALSLVEYSELRRTGLQKGALEALSGVLNLLSSSVLLITLLLISWGWTVVSMRLSSRDKQVCAASLFLQLLFGSLALFCASPTLCAAYMLSFNIVKFVITLGIIVAMNALTERLRNQPDGPTPLAAQLTQHLKLRQLYAFRIAFLAHLIVPILLLFIEATIVRWEEAWAVRLLEQLLSGFVYCVIGYTFRPQDQDTSAFLRDTREWYFANHRSINEQRPHAE